MFDVECWGLVVGRTAAVAMTFSTSPRSDGSFMACHEQLETLRDLLKSYGSCLVAYSGGVDSVFFGARGPGCSG